MIKNRVHACVVRRAGEIHEGRQKQACQKPEQMCELREQSYSSEARESGEDWDRDRSPIRRLSGNGEFTRLLKRLVDQAVVLGSCSRTKGEGQDGSNRKGGR